MVQRLGQPLKQEPSNLYLDKSDAKINTEIIHNKDWFADEQTLILKTSLLGLLQLRNNH